jgi:hypothetical protein|nr:MAG TPA: hypothetical protein [Caudoviricetes sp.]
MGEYNWKNIRVDKEGRYAEMSEHPPDKKAAENMKRKPYQNVDVLKYLQGKYKIGGDAGGAETGRKQCEE